LVPSFITSCPEDAPADPCGLPIVLFPFPYVIQNERWAAT
jgi:hypothetical protein